VSARSQTATVRPNSVRPSIALWGGASLSNVGDKLLFDVTRAGLAERLPGAGFTRFCPWAPDVGPAGDTGSAGDAGGAVRPLWVDPSGRWPGSGAFDAVVAIGGVFAGPPFVNFLMQAFTLGARPDLFDPRPVVAWHGVGLDDSVPPPSRPEWAGYLRALATRLDLATVRAPAAADRFRVAKARVPAVVPDPVFALPVQPGSRPAARSRPRIGVAVGEAAPSRRFLDTFADTGLVLRYLRNSGFDRATCVDPAQSARHELAAGQLAPKRDFSRQLGRELADLSRVGPVEFIAIDNVYDDAAAAKAFAGELGDAPVRLVTDPDADTLGEVFRDYDLVVVSRFHSAILALRAGVPFIAADPYWHPEAGTSKVHQLLAGLGLAARHWSGTGTGAGQAGAAGSDPIGAPTAPMSDLVAAALAAAADDRDRYAAVHTRALAALDELAAAIARPALG
jgi:Polysaccharide pyruvyl transferase